MELPGDSVPKRGKGHGLLGKGAAGKEKRGKKKRRGIGGGEGSLSVE